MAHTILNYLTHKVGRPDRNTAVKGPHEKRHTKHSKALPLVNPTILKNGSETERENKDTQRITIV